MKAYETTKIGENRGRPRIWLQGSKPALAGFLPGVRFRIRKDEQRTMLVLEHDVHGNRIVCRKVVGESEVPVIDINSLEVLSIFQGFSAVRIVVQEGCIRILPVAVEIAKKERLERLVAKLAAGEPLSCGSVSHGGGILDHALHAGIEAAGVKTRLAFANEIRPELLEHARTHNDIWDSGSVALAAPLQELVFDSWAMSKLPRTELLFGGLPCSGASLSGKASKHGAGHAEAHPEVGHLVVAFLALIARVSPAIILLENVKGYASSASMCILRNQLRDFGYVVHETVLRAQEFNTLEGRDRMCMVAVTEGLEFDYERLVKPAAAPSCVGDILEDVPLDSDAWSSMQGLKDKEERDRAAGKGFTMNIITAESTKVGVLGKGYARQRSTEPKLQHPTEPSLLRSFTPSEHAALKRVPVGLIKGLGYTIAHEVLGQGVCYEPFRAVGKLIGETLITLRHAAKALAHCSRPSIGQADLLALAA